MTTEMITLKLEDSFLGNIDNIVKKEGYQSRTEFIRTALREKVETSKLRQAMLEISHLKGASKKITSEESLEKIKKKAFNELRMHIK